MCRGARLIKSFASPSALGSPARCRLSLFVKIRDRVTGDARGCSQNGPEVSPGALSSRLVAFFTDRMYMGSPLARPADPVLQLESRAEKNHAREDQKEIGTKVDRDKNDGQKRED